MTAIADETPPGRVDGCPKRMTYGPCGGVRATGLCELETAPCPFLERANVVEFAAEHRPGTGDLPLHPRRDSVLLSAAANRPVVLTDLSVTAFDPGAVSAVAAVLHGSCDAVLVGEYQDHPDFPPAVMASLLAGQGLPAWITLTCRDRNRLVLEQEIAGLSYVGADGVLCVTGDIRAPGMRPGVTQVFDLDGTRLAAMAAGSGLPVAVAESPTSPPTGLRPARLLEKQRAGAAVGILNHVAAVGDVRVFVETARRIGVTLPIIASVAIYTDETSARVLQRFPGLSMDDRQIDSVLSAAAPRAAGLAAAHREARELLAIDGVVGVNISGLASGTSPIAAAEVKAELGRRIMSDHQ